MSVLKSILHHWNSTSKAYDTLHPETEVGQITDFGKGLLNQLAATTAQSVISALQTGSWFGQLLKLVLNASGVKYSIDTNGYVCLGSFFGGLIIQWGTMTITTNNEQGTHVNTGALPISANHFLQGCATYDFPTGVSYPVTSLSCSSSKVTIGAQLLPGYSGSPVNIRWVALFSGQ